MKTQVADRLKELITGMDADKLHIMSTGSDAGWVDISYFLPDLAPEIKRMLLERLERETG